MKGIRLERLRKELFKLVSNAYIFNVSDERLSSIRISNLKITNDLSLLKIYYDYTDNSIQRKLMQELMERSSGFIKNQIAGARIMRRIPQVTYHYDATEDRASELDEIFAVIQAEKRRSYEEDSDGENYEEDLNFFEEDYEDDFDDDDDELDEFEDDFDDVFIDDEEDDF